MQIVDKVTRRSPLNVVAAGRVYAIAAQFTMITVTSASAMSSIAVHAQERVHLRESRTMALPVGFTPVGASRSGGSFVLIDSSHGQLLILRQDTSWIFRHDSIRGAIAVTEQGNGTIEVLRPQSIIRLDPSGRFIDSRQVVQAGTRIVLGVADSSIWSYVIRTDTDVSLVCGQSLRHTMPMLEWETGFVANAGPKLLHIVMDKYPFPYRAADLKTCTVREVSSSSVPVVSDSSWQVNENWRAVAVAAVGDEAWITFADKRLERRMIVVADPTLGPHRFHQLSLPFAFLGVLGKEVLAIRTLNETEVVFYEFVQSTESRR